MKQEPQLLHSHSVQDKTQTLNIVETQHTNTAARKPDPHMTNTSNHTSQRIPEINMLEDSIAHENNITDYNHCNQSEGLYSF